MFSGKVASHEQPISGGDATVHVDFHRSPNEPTDSELHSNPEDSVSQATTIGEPINPFLYCNAHQRPLQYFKMALVYLLLFVPRLLVMITALLLGYLIAVMILCGISAEEQRTRPIQRPILRFALSVCARALLWGLGFWWISVKEWHRFGDPAEAPILISNHVSFVEVIYFIYAHNVQAVGKDGAVNAPFIGKIAQALQCIPVARSDPNSRRHCASEIRRRTRWMVDEETRDLAREHGPWRPLLIFPEGTCSNGQSVICFKTGAFSPGVAVQPVAIELPYQHLDLSFVGAVGGAGLVLTMLGQLYNSMVVTYLPVHIPSEAERVDPELFAHHARANMANALKVPMTNHTYEDVVLGLEVEAMQLPLHEFNLEMGNFSEFGLQRALLLLRRFAELDTDGDGVLSTEEFGTFFGLNEHPRLRDELFRRWDRAKDGKINFREFLLVVSSQQLRICNRRRPAQLATAVPPASAGGTVIHVHDGAAPHAQLPSLSPVEGTDSSVCLHTAADDEEQQLMYAFTVLFGTFDTSHNGYITKAEFVSGMRVVCPGLDSRAIRRVFAEMDANADGVVELQEFLAWSREHPVFVEYLFQLLEKHDVDEGVVQ